MQICGQLRALTAFAAGEMTKYKQTVASATADMCLFYSWSLLCWTHLMWAADSHSSDHQEAAVEL
jgi:hypothetical protein